MEQRTRIADIVLTAVAAAAFGWLAVQRRSGATMRLDLAVRRRVHASSSPPLTAIARALATVGSPIVLTMLFAIVIVAFRRLSWTREAIALTAVMAAAIVCNLGLKRLIHCARPEPFFGTEPSSYSFPSGHALYSLSFYGVIAVVLAAHAPPGLARLAIWAAAAFLVIGIGLSRVYLGVHYPSDVVAGYVAAIFLIGAAFAFCPGVLGCRSTGGAP
jgi:undecaprenyl-diphosphatase